MERKLIIKNINRKLKKKAWESTQISGIIDYCVLNYYIGNADNYFSKDYRTECLLDASNLIVKTVENINDFSLSFGMWDGYVGVGVLLNQYGILPDTIKKLNAYIKFNFKAWILQDKVRNEIIPNANTYDLLYGVSCILIYVKQYDSNDLDFITICEEWIKSKLISNGETFSNLKIGPINLSSTKFSKEKHDLNRVESYVDLSISHGTIGLIAALIYNNDNIEFLEECVDFYLDTYSKLPYNVAPTYIFYRNNEVLDIESTGRQSWCYGKISQLLVLARAYKKIGDDRKLFILSNIINRIIDMDMSFYGLDCPTMCHGYSGIYLMFSKINSNYAFLVKDRMLLKNKIEKIENKIGSFISISEDLYFPKLECLDNGIIQRFDITTSSINGIVSIIIPYLLERNNYEYDFYSVFLGLI